MQYLYTPDQISLGQTAARWVAREILINPDLVLGLPTGSTPITMYNYLVQLAQNSLISFSRVRTFNLDEYVDLASEHLQSYATFMHHYFWDKIDLPLEAREIPRGNAQNLAEECQRYDKKIEQMGGIDIQILGLGLNGHIGFNEPSHDLKIKTHVVNLTPETIQANSRFFADIREVPQKAITMGVGSIMQARKILLLVSGEQKKGILNRTLYGPVSPEVPASILQLHAGLTVLTDFLL